MKQLPMRTKWHKIRECIAAGELYTTAPKGASSLHYTEAGVDVTKLNALLNAAESAPKFVIANELLEMIQEDAFQLSLRDMWRAKVARLPFPTMVVEINRQLEKGVVQLAIILAEGKIADKGAPTKPIIQIEASEGWDFYAWVLALNKDEGGEYASVSPALLGINLKEMEKHPKGDVWLGFNGTAASYMEANAGINELVEGTFQKDGGAAGTAILAALLLMSTQGVAKQVIDIAPSVNKDREKKNRPQIPQHTYVHIGRVYRSATGDEADEYDARKSPRPHWRRGHNRRIRFGKGRQSFRWHYFHPRLVSFHGDTVVEELKQPSYVVNK